ncbi:MAG: BatA domain-containing protein [Phycisphaeraceae bacterium]|nr:MAG: BatA domain-containing protein [Phycisphaeraceae bacterium]
MTFLNPQLLAVGLAAIAAPILIHILMRRRRRPVPWAAMRFLLDAYRRQRRRTRLEQLLLLASRCVLVALIALAFGRPLLGAGGWLETQGPRTLVIVLDNSLTAGVVGQGGATDFEGLKATAESLLKDLSPARGDRAGLIAAAGPAENIVFPPSADIAGVIQSLQRVTPADSAADWTGAVAMVRELQQQGAPALRLAMLSGWRQGSADTAKPLPPLATPEAARDGAAPIAVQATRPAARPAVNVMIESIVPLSSVVLAPGAGGRDPAPALARARLRRFGTDATGETRVTMSMSSASGAMGPSQHATITWAPGQETAVVSLAVPPPQGLAGDSGAALIASLDPDDLPADDRAVLPIPTRGQLRAAIVSPRRVTPGGIRPAGPDQYEPADWLTLAVSPSASAFDRRDDEVVVDLIDPQAATGEVFLTHDIVFVPRPDLIDARGWEALRASLDAGGVVFVTPPPGAASQAWHGRFRDAFALPWTLDEEPRGSGPEVQGWAVAPGVGEAEQPLFALVGPELAELAKPVRVFRVWPPKAPAPRPALALADGTPLMMITTGPTGRGLVAYLSTAPDLAWTNLPAMPLMVPLIQETIRQGLGRAQGPAWASAGQTPPWPQGSASARKVDLSGGTTAGEGVIEIIGRGEGPTPRAERSAGLWRAVDASGRTRGLVAVNPDPAGSNTGVQSPDAVMAWLGALAGPTRASWIEDTRADAPESGVSDAVPPTGSRDTPWDAYLWAAVASLLLIEMAIARRVSHASLDAAAPGLSGAVAHGRAAP